MYNFDQLFRFMKKHDSSDLYLTVGRPPCFKINGTVKEAGKEEITVELCNELLKSVVSDEQYSEFQERKELNIALSFPEIGRFRLNAYKQMSNTAMVIRKIETDIKSLSDLRLPPTIADISMEKRGLILVVGATGSGKSTTLAAMIDHRNANEAGHIMTIEDPVEFVHQHKKCVVSQREVGVDTDSFQNALKNALRQAPTVILIGEIRDEQTMEHALSFAETGHLCLATLHSNNANQAMERVLNFFPPERHRQIYLQLSLNLKAVVSQRLVKTLDGGRAAAIEILLGTSRVKELIKNGEIDLLKDVMSDGAINGMQTFDQALFNLLQEGRITEAQALENADSVTDLRLKIKMAGSESESGEGVEGENKPLFEMDLGEKKKKAGEAVQ